MRIPFLSSLFFFKRSEEENVSRVYKTRQDEVWNVINDRDPSIQKSTVLTLDTLSFSHFLTCTHTHTLFHILSFFRALFRFLHT